MLDRKRKLNVKRSHSQEPEQKLRRRILNNTLKTTTKHKERTEGTTYQSGMGFTAQEPVVPPVVELGPSAAPPHKQNVKLSVPWSERNEILQPVTENMGDISVIFFDTESTGFGATDQIIQLSAQSLLHQFNTYIYPKVNINPKATTHKTW
jgi:hypothetical protein